MKRIVLLAALAVAAPLLAIELPGSRDEACRAYTQLGTLYEVRGLMMRSYFSSYDVQKLIDNRIDYLRGPLQDGGFRWVRWVRPDKDAPDDKEVHEVRAAQGSGSDTFENSADHAFNVKVIIPAKRSLFKGNNPVYVGTLKVNYTANGRNFTKELPINDWMSPDTQRTLEFDTIADRATATLDVAAKPNDVGEAVAEIHFRKAIPTDDPANPDYGTIQSLRRIRSSTDAATVDSEIAAVERTIFPTADPLPLLTIFDDLRRADKWMRSTKADEQEKGQKLLKDTLSRLR